MLLVKIGGGSGINLDGIVSELAGLTRPFVVLHGANGLRDEWAAATGVRLEVVESVSGMSSVVSDEAAVDLLMATYAGVRNKRVVEAFRRRGVNAVGLSGLDGGVVTGRRNRGIRVRKNGRKMRVRDHSGKATSVNVSLLRLLLEEGYTPVLTVPIAGEEGEALNSENDDILALLAAELKATEVFSFLEAPGLLADARDESSVVASLAPDALEAWEEKVRGRMRRKVKALGRMFALSRGRPLRVVLADGRISHPVAAAMEGRGTVIESSSGGADVRETDARDRAGRAPSEAPASCASELDVYGKRGPVLVEGRGVRVRDREGREYLDFIAGHGALVLGHGHPALLAAQQRQGGTLAVCPNSFATPLRARYMDALAQTVPDPLGKVFLSNSGAEAVEAALKFAVLLTGRSTFVAATGAFHGRTLGALSLTADARFREPFQPLLAGVRRVPFNDIFALCEAVDDTVAGVILEPVQGEVGVYPADAAYLEAAREVCMEHGALLIMDEVQTGFGRTGRLFAFEHAGIVPDMVCLAKGIAGGFPMGATVVRRDAHIPRGLHGSTFGGNPLACATALAVLEELERGGWIARVEEKGARFTERLSAANLSRIRAIRRRGLMVGIELRTRAAPMLPALQERGLLALAGGRRTLRLLPPLVVGDADLDQAAEILRDCLA